MNKPISEDDMDIFRQAVDNIRIRETPPASRSVKVSSQAAPPPPSVDGETPLSFCRPGIQKKVFHQLKKSSVSASATIDLHGMTQEAAEATIIRFIEKQIAREQKIIKIVHGKGGTNATLKNLTNHLLRQLNPVLAFCSAPPHDGGTGALHVLLQSARKQHG